MLNKLIIDPSSKKSIFLLRDTLSNEICPIIKSGRPIIVLCIGTDRSTGDSLGPLVGDKLKFLIRDKIYLYGNLENPVHAKNLSQVLDEIKTKHINPFIIAIDACLGSLQNVGKIIVEGKPLSPGSAMNKDLPKVGDLSITGIVNISGAMEFMVLQNTRLFTVMELAETISKGLYHSIIKTIGGRKSTSIIENKLAENIEA
ncbi:spore protease YyaC [Clostridium sp. A1-XYC3]|uniref:Spore protease YyaC n=1 Tax=Clostridium tanneri TaxID=3037988 RepID=A0ABU4JXA1_9CLOT|nr:spore protease YyaC [Clostridium sp. A1-XYC3]MDW8802785.1 spore protease YyaC [Clostridium sp. A1-XYC3]